MKITTTGWYKRRDGGKREVFGIHAERAFVKDTDSSWYFVFLEHGMANKNGPEASFDLIVPWTDPEIGSLEWVRTLPPETKVWNATWIPNQWMTVSELPDAGLCLDGWHIVGTAEWANALPEGTKVRLRKWMDGTPWAVKRDGKWYFWSLSKKRETEYGIPTGDSWELYREPALRPWKTEEVPVGSVLKTKDTGSRWVLLGVNNVSEILVAGDNGEFKSAGFILNHYEHSLDGGKTWLPCGVEDAR